MTFPPSSWSPSANELATKRILVTGAGDGIGRAAALAYASAGAELLLLGKTEAKLDRLYDEILASGAPTPAVIPCNLATVTYDGLCALAGELAGEFGHLDGLLHNASLLGDRKPLSQANVGTWHEVMQVNVNATFMLTQVLLPLLEQAPRASIILTSSGVGRRGKAFWGAYAVSKFATEGLMQVLSEELGGTSNVRVNSLNPGPVNTAMRRTAYPAEPPETNPSPAELMPLWLYLMSDASKDINGCALDAQPSV
jgi:NAD(P)-dependent dehydrogenase (short-subunit alcohol dehydrogenase family)